MANTMRWRYGETNPVVLPVASATVIEIGDLVYLDTTTKPAGSVTYGGSLAATQESFHDKFAGVAMQPSRNGDTHDIRVATTGVFEFGLRLGHVRGGRADRRRRQRRRHGPVEPAGDRAPRRAIPNCRSATAPSGSTRPPRRCWWTWSARSARRPASRWPMTPAASGNVSTQQATLRRGDTSRDQDSRTQATLRAGRSPSGRSLI